MRYKPGMVGRRLAVVALVAGCTGEPTSERAPVTGPAVPVVPVTTGPATLPSPPAEEHIRLVLLSPGAEPRQQLRYRSRVGAEHTFTLDNHTDMAMSSNGHRMFDRTFDTEGKLAIRVDAVDGDRITLKVKVISLEVPSYDPVTLMKPKTAANQTGVFVVTDRGRHISSDFKFLEEHEEAADVLQLTDYFVLLPVEPVGVGAKWEVHSHLQRNGIAFAQVDTHEILELGPNRARTRATLVQKSWPQVVSGLAEDPVTVFELKTFESVNTNESELVFDQPLPAVSTTKFEFSADMPIRRPEGTQDITLKFNATLSTRREGYGGR